MAPANAIRPMQIRRDGSAAPISVAFAPSGIGSVSPVTAQSRRVFPNALTDTDYAVGATAIGAETAWVLRSQRSPQSVGLDLTLPAGARLEADGDPFSQKAGGLKVTRGGDTLASVMAPFAYDADGTTVPVSMRADGTKVVLDVAHRSADVRYPIFVDPVIHNQ